MADLEPHWSASDSDSDSVIELSIVPTTQSSARLLKRKREASTAGNLHSFSCSGCDQAFGADTPVYFLPFCGCIYCGRCVTQSIVEEELEELYSNIGSSTIDLIRLAMSGKVDTMIKLPTSSWSRFTCKRRGHARVPGALECYGTECPLCDLEGTSSDSRVYLPCGHPYCKSHIMQCFKEKGKRTCPCCRADVPEEESHFKRDGTYALSWPKKFW